MIKPCPFYNIIIAALVLSLTTALSVFAAKPGDRFSVASGNWNSTATWSATSGGPPGASVPGKNDDVYLENGYTVTVTADAPCSNLIFSGANASLNIDASVTLTVKFSISLDKQVSQNSACFISGSGTISCRDVNVGSATNSPPTAGSSVYNHTLTSTIANFNISDDLIINSYFGSVSNMRNGCFNLEAGTVTIDGPTGSIITNNASAGNTSSFSMATGAQSGTLILAGLTTPFNLSGTGSNIINLNGTASLVNYSKTDVQNVLATTYRNITLSGSGAKTITGITVNGLLSMEGTATAAGTAPTFGELASLQYKGSAAQTTGIEFPAAFSGSGGIIINNTSGVILNLRRNISSRLTFVNGRLNTGINILNLSSAAEVIGAGAGKYVNGNLQKDIAAGTVSKTFEVGGITAYTPVVVTFTGDVTVAGSITAKSTDGDHPNIATSTFNSAVTVNRYWTLTNEGVSGFSVYSATFGFIAGDIDPGADYNYFYIGNYDSSGWSYPAVGILTATSVQATGLSIFGDFQIGELPVASYRSRQSGAWDQTSTWEAFNGTIWSNATSTPTSAAGYIIIRASHIVTNSATMDADQVIIDPGGRLNLNADINVINGPATDFSVFGTLDCNTANVTGPGSFLLAHGSSIIIRSPDGITLSGASGNIRTTDRTFDSGANYIYNGSSLQVTGNGLPSLVRDLIIDNPAGVQLSSSVISNGTLTLDNGAFSVGMNTLTLQTSDSPLSRTSGTLSLTEDSNISFGSPGNTAGASFILPPGIFTLPPTVNNLSIYRDNSITLNEQMLSIKGILLCNGPLYTNGNLTLLSSGTGTALIDGSGTGQVNGNVTMQRYLPSGFGYKYFSSPFQDAVVGEFGDDIALGSFTFFRFDENSSASGWASYHTPLTNPLAILQGYAVNFGAGSTPNIADITGSVNNGELTVTIYNHNNLYTKGFNLLGNPYPSPIDWNAVAGWTKTNIDDALYYFKASTTDQYGGAYSTYINGVSSDGEASNTIPSMQGFFIHVSNGAWPVTGTLTMDNRVRTTNMTHSFTKSKNYSPPYIRISATFSDSKSCEDPVVIYFDEKATSEFDRQFDALKLLNTDQGLPNLYFLTSNMTRLSISALPPLYDGVSTIPLGLKLYRSGNIVFRIKDLDQSLEGMRIYLTDATAGTEQELYPDKEYSVTLPNGEYSDRFFIKFSNIIPDVITDVREDLTDHDLLEVYSSSGKIKAEINSLEGRCGTFAIHNITGQLLMKENIYVTGYHEFAPELKAGIYIITFYSGNQKISKKIVIAR